MRLFGRGKLSENNLLILLLILLLLLLSSYLQHRKIINLTNDEISKM